MSLYFFYHYNAILAQKFSDSQPTAFFRTCYSEKRYGMDAKQVKQLGPMLNKYLRQFDSCFALLKRSDWRASRFRSRQVICKTGSIPRSTKSRQAASEPNLIIAL